MAKINIKEVRHIYAGPLFISMLLLLIATACQKSTPVRTALRGEAQGTYYSIIYYDTLGRDFTADVDSLLHDFDQTASLWIENSLINKVNADTLQCEITPLFADMLYKSQEIQRYTEGAFDCRIGQLVSAMGFARKQRTTLSEETIDSLLIYCRGNIWIDTTDKGTLILHKQNAKTMIDFNAIAQGYSVDMVCRHLDSKGIANYLVDIGGEIRTKGCKPKGIAWNVGIERPANDKNDDRQVEVTVGLTDLSLVTSGSYRKYYEIDGIRYSHTIDPSTGQSVTHTTLSTSVIDSTAWRADALATAFMVMGCEKSKLWLQKHPEIQEAYFIYDDGKELKSYATPAMQQRIDKQAKQLQQK